VGASASTMHLTWCGCDKAQGMRCVAALLAMSVGRHYASLEGTVVLPDAIMDYMDVVAHTWAVSGVAWLRRPRYCNAGSAKGQLVAAVVLVMPVLSTRFRETAFIA
jgi:hypothetical protein